MPATGYSACMLQVITFSVKAAFSVDLRIPSLQLSDETYRQSKNVKQSPSNMQARLIVCCMSAYACMHACAP